MKNKLLLIGLCLSAMACSEESNEPAIDENDQAGNKVLLLKVDLMTSVFEGGKEITFEEASTFTITHEYTPPGDFGEIKLKYGELDETLFDGSIHWMGLGEISYPEDIDLASSFAGIETSVPLPDESLCELVVYDEFIPTNTWPFAPEHEVLWAAVDNLKIVKDYRENNPNAKVHFFLYTPSVGDGDPAEWDWFIILKN